MESKDYDCENGSLNCVSHRIARGGEVDAFLVDFTFLLYMCFLLFLNQIIGASRNEV